MLRLYSLVLWLLQPLVRLRMRRRARAEPLYAHALGERFGHYGADLAGVQQPGYLWVHAVSLGETRAAAALIAQLREAVPGLRLLLTHGTATGRAQGQSLLREGDVQVWQPWDTPAAVERFLLRFRPRMGLLMETEVWPNWVQGCAHLGIPLCLVNARLSEKSLQSALRLKALSFAAYRGLHAVWAQSAEDARRLRLLGAPVVDVVGNFKFDATPDPALMARGQGWRTGLRRPVVMFASSRAGEELLLLQSLQSNRVETLANKPQAAIENIANVQWLIVPRHPQRFEDVVRLWQDQGFSVARRSEWSKAPQGADIWIGDSLGEMALYFALADVALLGGSFERLGGQNLIEAAACGCPVVMGPHTFNFAEAAQLAEAAGAAFRAADMNGAIAQALRLLADAHAREQASQAGRTLAATHQGAARRTAQAVAAMLTTSVREPVAG